MKRLLSVLLCVCCLCFVFVTVSCFSSLAYADEYIDHLSQIRFNIPSDWEKEDDSYLPENWQALFKPSASNDLEFFLSVDDMWGEMSAEQELPLGREKLNMDMFTIDEVVKLILDRKDMNSISYHEEKIGDKDYYIIDFDDEIELLKTKIPMHVKMAVSIDNGYYYMYRLNMYEGINNSAFYTLMNAISYIGSEGSQDTDNGLVGTRYEIPEISLNVVIPDDYMVVTRDLKEGDPVVDQFGVTRKAIVDTLIERDIYLDALNFATNNEIMVNCKPSKIENYRDIDDSSLKQANDSFLETLPAMGIKAIESDLYNTYQTKWIYRKLVTGTGNDTVYQIVYYTVVKNMAYNVDMESYGVDFTPEQEKLLRDIVDNCEFTAFNRSGAA